MMFPLMKGGGELDLDADTPEAFLYAREGVHPYAMTNPIYVDTDGDGRWRGPMVD